MRIHTLDLSQDLRAAPDEVWAFFSDPGNLARLTPPEMPMRRPGGDQSAPVQPGQLLWFDVRLAPFIWMTWLTEITRVEPGRSFTDDQLRGPFQFWRHRHDFLPLENGGCRVRDLVHYALPLQPFSEPFHGPFVRRMLEKLFHHRHAALRERFG
jgi:ligand-binding SRPBCC domain-containing protein